MGDQIGLQGNSYRASFQLHRSLHCGTEAPSDHYCCLSGTKKQILYLRWCHPPPWWRESKNPTVRAVMSWVDAIVFALVAVYIINLFFFQNYQIPSSSLEKSLMVGDFLFVSKVAYGPRVPNTPFSFPLVQNTLPILNCKSYLEHPQLDYKRLLGTGHGF